MNEIRQWMSITEGLQQTVHGFIQQANDIAQANGVRTRFEPLTMGKGVQITWMERRQDDRVNVEEFLTQLVRLADESGMPLQLSIPGHDTNNEALFAHFGFRIEDAGVDLIMHRQPEPTFITDFAESAIVEKSPPGWQGTVKSMKKHKDISNPWALAWSMKNKGYHSHKTKSGKNKKESIEVPSIRSYLKD